MAVKAKVMHKIKRGPDFEQHIRQVRAEGSEFVEIRDYVPSEKWYGRGVQIEPRHIQEVIDALRDVARITGWDGAGREAGPGQQALFDA